MSADVTQNEGVEGWARGEDFGNFWGSSRRRALSRDESDRRGKSARLALRPQSAFNPRISAATKTGTTNRGGQLGLTPSRLR